MKNPHFALFVLLALVLLITGCAPEPIRLGTQETGLPTPQISELIDNRTFHMKKIELEGKYLSAFELSGLFELNSSHGEGVWIDFTPELIKLTDEKTWEAIKGRTLRIQGILDRNSKGHMGGYIGTLEAEFLETVD